MRCRTPLAWLDLVHDQKRFVTSLVGIAFAVFIVFVEVGFVNGIHDSQTDLVSKLNADLILVNRLKEDLLPVQPFSRRRIVQAMATEGVADVYPVYIEEMRASWKNYDDGQSHLVMTIGIDPTDPVFLIPEIQAQQHLLQMPETGLFDKQSRALYGELVAGKDAELAGRRIRLVGTFDVGPNFRADGLLVMSDTNFIRFFQNPATGRPDPDRIELGLLKVDSGHSVEQVRRRLNTELPDDVAVLTKEELNQRIRTYWSTAQPIGVVFGMGAAIGFVIGVTICYQILFNDISDKFPQLATLKALGYGNRYLVILVLQKAVMLAICGFFIGLLLSASVYSFLEQTTGIRMRLTIDRAAVVLGLSVLMCVLAGLLATRKVLGTDPAELF